MSDEVFAALSDEDNFALLDQVYLLLRATEDIIVNESSDLFHLVYACSDAKLQGKARNQLDLLYSGITGAARILGELSNADRESWIT